MKKVLIFLIFIISFGEAFGQPVTQRSTGTTTVNDPRWMSSRNMYIPRYADTTAANLDLGIDSCGAMIYSYSGSIIYYRQCSPKKWTAMSSGGGTVTAASNGLSLSGTTAILGGSALSQYTPITVGSYPMTLINNGVFVSTQSDSNSLKLANNRVATSITDSSISPAIIQSVYGWKTSGGAGAALVKFRTDVYGRFVNPGGGALYRIMASMNGADYSAVFSIRQDGVIPDNLNLAGHPIGLVGSNSLRYGQASLNSNVSGGQNVAIGPNTLQFNTNGSYNTAVGYSPLSGNIIGDYNTAMGYAALVVNDTSLNTAVGAFAMTANTKGYQNAAFGVNAMRDNTIGEKNTAIGTAALEENTLGGFNTFVGHDAGLHNLTGDENVGLGWLAWAQNITGNNNVGIGNSTGRTITNGSNSVFIGFNSGYNASQNDTVDNAIALGANSYTTASNQMVLGNSSLTQAIMYGPTHNNTSALTVLMMDTTDNKLYHIPASQLSGVTPTWQQTLTAGSTLTGDNTIVNGDNTLTITNNTLAVDNGFSLTSTSTAAAANSQVLLNVSLSGVNSNSGNTTIAAKIRNDHSGTTSTNQGLVVGISGATTASTGIISTAIGGSGSANSIGIEANASASITNTAVKGMATGSGVTTNIGGSFTATSATNNYAIIVPANSGTVGIGNSAPVALLTIGTAGSQLGSFSVAGNTSGTVTIQPAAAAGTYTLTLPTTDGAASEFLQTDGNGVLTWASAASGSSTWNDITDPTGSQSLTHGAGEITTWTNQNTTGDLFTVNSSTMTTSSMFSFNSTSTALAAGNNLLELVMSGANGSASITATGLRISVTNTGTTSTNTGIDITASGASTNYAVLANAGSIFATEGYYIGVSTSARTAGFRVGYSSAVNTLETFGGTRMDLSAPSSYVRTSSRFDVGTGAALGNVVSLTVWESSTAGTADIANFVTSAGSIRAGVKEDGTVFSGLAGTALGHFQLNGNTSGTITIQSAAAAGTWTWTVPANDGDANQVLMTDGSGVTSWATGPGLLTVQTLTDGASITWNASSGVNAVVTITGTGKTLSITNPVAGQTYTVRIIQGDGSDTITTWPTNTKWPNNGTAPTLSTGAGEYDVIVFYYDGTNYYGTYNTDFA